MLCQHMHEQEQLAPQRNNSPAAYHCPLRGLVYRVSLLVPLAEEDVLGAPPPQP